MLWFVSRKMTSFWNFTELQLCLVMMFGICHWGQLLNILKKISLNSASVDVFESPSYGLFGFTFSFLVPSLLPTDKGFIDQNYVLI